MSNCTTIGDVAAIQAITKRLAQHSRGVDRADAAMLADCYHDDATVDYRFFNGPARQFATILAGAQKAGPVTLHRTAQMWVALDGDRARSESYIMAYAQAPDEDGTVRQRLICGRYLDRHERRDGVWRLSHRTYVLDTNRNWAGAFASSDLGPLANHVPQGGHGAADTGVALLARAAAHNAMSSAGEKTVSQTIPDPESIAIDAIISRQQIADLTMAYCRGVDRADVALLKSVFHDDSVVVTGVFNGGGHDFATEICRIVTETFTMCFHSIANQWIEVDGDRAIGETYVIAASDFACEGGSEMLTGGRYVDRFERRDGVWKIAERNFVLDWNRTDPPTSSAEGMYAALDLRGAWGKADPVYAFWGGGA